jgi:hypothetical protein
MVTGLLVVGICATVVALRCNFMNVPPVGLVYPDSTLQSRSVFGIGTALYPVVEYQYAAVAQPETIADYYETMGECQKHISQVRCYIQLNDPQESIQLVSIDLSPASPSRYNVQVRWHGCSYSWSE